MKNKEILIKKDTWFYVIAYRDIEAIKLFLKSGKIDINWKDARGATGLYKLCEWTGLSKLCEGTGLSQSIGNEIKLIQLLLKYEANPNLVNEDSTNNEKETCLFRLCKVEHPEVAEILLKKGATLSIDFQDIKGWTALMWATYYKSYKTMKLLIKYNASYSLKNKDNMTAFDMIKDETMNREDKDNYKTKCYNLLNNYIKQNEEKKE